MFTAGPALLGGSGGISYPYLVYDTFSGGGLLSNHTGEQGATWTGGGATYTLAGGFACPTSGFGTATYATPATFGDGYVEVVTTNRTEYIRGGTIFQSHFEGTNNSTTIVDNSPYAVTSTCYNNAKITTAKSRFGSSCATFGTTGITERDFIETNPYPSVSIPTGGQLCLEGFVNFRDFGTRAIVQFTEAGVPDYAWTLVRFSDNLLYLLVGNTGGGGTYVMGGTGNIYMQTNAWYHIALVRDSVAFRIYINGILQVSWNGTSGGKNWDYGMTIKNIQIGTWGSATPNSSFMWGYLDEMRFVVGDSVYTSNFIPPVRKFPD
jgi:hypothetical protein